MTPQGPSLDDRREACLRPDSPVVMRQSWHDLLFVHWKEDPQTVQSTLPPGLTVDTFAGDAYIGLVPFYMRNIRPRFCPAVPGISHFLELNVRTYVYDRHNRPGVWFYSLDANQSLAVLVARTLFQLPYYRASMSAKQAHGTIHYASLRKHCPENERTTVSYTPGEVLPPPGPGSLEYFLLERYYLFSWNAKRKQLFSGRVDHAPYEARDVTVENLKPGVMNHSATLPPSQPVHRVYSPGVDVDVFALQPVEE